MKTLYRTVAVENGDKWDRIITEKPSLPFKIATEKEKFDFCIKKQLLLGAKYLPGCVLAKRNESSFGFYLKRYERFYDRYLSKDVMLDSILSDDIRKSYGEGKGNEFKTGKFYSVASSSRFAVSCFSEPSLDGLITVLNKIDINGKSENVSILLEKGLEIDGMPKNNTPPQMDVVLKTHSGDIYFIEVKCHEIFDTSEHKQIKLKSKYLLADSFKLLPLETKKLSTIVDKMCNEFISINGRFLEAKDFNCNIVTTHFDFKQFICHLLGILSYKNINTNDRIHFHYMFYKNDEYLKIGNGNIYLELEKEMSEIFGRFTEIFPEIEFGYSYNRCFDTLKSLEKEDT